MDVRGLMLVGSFVGVAPVKKKDDSVVPDLYKVQVDCDAVGGRPLIRDAAFFATDRDTGQPTPFAQQLDSMEIEPGQLVAVKVRTKVSGSWVNFEPVSILVLAGSPEEVPA